jgi:glycosyltransferase involved in cell wall biosynthesis
MSFKNTQMKISVIIPCYNAAETICPQLDALEQQILAEIQPLDWEIIVVDNRSKDDSWSIVESYQSRLPNLKIISAPDRPGAAYARNVGANVAQGEFLAFCDADDVVDQTWVEAMYQALLRHDFVASRFDHDRFNGLKQGPQMSHLQGITPSFFCHAGGCGMGIRTSIHAFVGGFAEEIALLEDMEYCFKVQVSGPKLFYAEDAIVYIRHRSTVSGGFQQAWKWAVFFPLICKRYESSGLRKQSLWTMLKTYLGMIKRLIQGALKGNLKPCLWELGWRLGYLAGCIRHRSMPFVEPN